MKLFSLLFIFASLALLPGCGRKSEAPPTGAPKPAAVSIQEEPAAAPPPTAATEAPVEEPKERIEDTLPTAPPDSAARFPVHKELTAALHLYQMDNRKMPANFEVLVKERYVKETPKPPPGKHFALDRKRLQVVIMD